MTHAMSILVTLVILLVLMVVINRWRERRLTKQMENFLSPSQQDILLQSPQKPLSQARNKEPNNPPISQAIDADFLALKRALDARNQARKKD